MRCIVAGPAMPSPSPPMTSPACIQVLAYPVGSMKLEWSVTKLFTHSIFNHILLFTYLPANTGYLRLPYCSCQKLYLP